MMSSLLRHSCLSLLILYSVHSIFSLPNIRIQVNNENLQSPPYLLQAIKDAELVQGANDQQSSKPTIGDQSISAHALTPDNNKPQAIINEKNTLTQTISNSHSDSKEIDQHESDSFNKPSSVQGHATGGSVDIEPESSVKSSLNEGFSHATSDLASLDSNQNQMVDTPKQQVSETSFLGPVKHDKLIKPQLAVANSHLKKPATIIEDESSSSTSHLDNGPKSLISPSVATDANSESENHLKRKTSAINFADTLEPSQIMNGVTNVSTVPATITREYGHQTRTRVTLGGGYVRNKSPPLVNPASDAYVDDRPEKPVVPLERPNSDFSPDRKTVDESRIVEIPEKISLPDSALVNKHKQSFQSNASNKQLDTDRGVSRQKADGRCRRDGVMTFEHPTACDRYFYCQDGLISEHVCPNGLLYGTRDTVVDFCVHRWKVVCGEKSIPNPISSPGCRWQYGIFSVQGSPKCSPDFYECTAGSFNVRKCSIEGQVYDDRTKSCKFGEQVGCKEDALADFKCPLDDQANTYWPFPRYFLNERSLIHCVNDKPEIVRCTEDERVDPEHLHCVPKASLKDSSAELSSDSERKARKKQNNDN